LQLYYTALGVARQDIDAILSLDKVLNVDKSIRRMVLGENAARLLSNETI
jgi:hypothetical protein